IMSIGKNGRAEKNRLGPGTKTLGLLGHQWGIDYSSAIVFCRQAGPRKGVENAFPVDIFGPPRISSYSVRPNLGAGGREFKSHRPDQLEGLRGASSFRFGA